MTAATAEESNERILTFLEDIFLQSGNYEEFFVVIKRLIEMPSALPIIEKLQIGNLSIMYMHTYVCILDMNSHISVQYVRRFMFCYIVYV